MTRRVNRIFWRRSATFSMFRKPRTQVHHLYASPGALDILPGALAEGVRLYSQLLFQFTPAQYFDLLVGLLDQFFLLQDLGCNDFTIRESIKKLHVYQRVIFLIPRLET